jgi:hypothetical protein
MIAKMINVTVQRSIIFIFKVNTFVEKIDV